MRPILRSKASGAICKATLRDATGVKRGAYSGFIERSVYRVHYNIDGNFFGRYLIKVSYRRE